MAENLFRLRADIEHAVGFVESGDIGDRRDLFDQRAVFGFSFMQPAFGSLFRFGKLLFADQVCNDGRQQFQVTALGVFDQIVARPELHRLDCDGGAVGAGEHYHRDRHMAVFQVQLVQEINAVEIRQVIIEQDEVEFLRFHQVQPGLRGFGLGQL